MQLSVNELLIQGESFHPQDFFDLNISIMIPPSITNGQREDLEEYLSSPMDPNPFPASTPEPRPVADTPSGLTKREYFAVHLFEAVTANLSMNCSMQDKVNHAVDAADALLAALDRKKV